MVTSRYVGSVTIPVTGPLTPFTTPHMTFTRTPLPSFTSGISALVNPRYAGVHHLMVCRKVRPELEAP